MSKINKIVAMVREFQTTMGQNPSFELSVKLAAEEAKEALDACYALQANPSLETMEAFTKECADACYTMTALTIHIENGTALFGEDLTPEMVENLNLARSAAEMQFDAGNLFFPEVLLISAIEKVHASNMTKLGDDGKPVYNEDGKVVKGPNYKAPDLSEEAKLLLASYEVAHLLSAA
jgi:hypothetical protein